MSGAESYVEEWLAIEPGATIALRFCAPSQHALFGLWGALQAQLDAARFDLSEPTVAQAKLGWWCDELRQGGKGTARHPLLRAVLDQDAATRIDPSAWQALGDAAWIESMDESVPVDLDAAVARHARYATRLAAIESLLFAATTAPDAVAIGQWLRHWRASVSGDGSPRWRWPMQLLARHQVVAESMLSRPLPPAARDLLRDIARELDARLTLADAGGFWRRWRISRDRWQLREWRSGRVVAGAPRPLQSLWSTWKAARAAVATQA